MVDKKVSVRVAMEGGKVVEAQLQGIGKAGSQAMGELGRSSGSLKAGLGNAAFQVQDFFVQVGGGTSATRALSQQLPQLLGSFGLFGILAGTAAAALLPLIGSLWDLEPPAEAAERAIKDLESALSALKAADKAVSAPQADLVQKYGAQAAAARELLEIERQLAQIKAERAFATSTEVTANAFGAGKGFGEVGQLSAELAVVSQLQQEYARLTSEIEALSSSTTANAGQRLDSLLLDRDEIQGRIDAFGGLGKAIDDIADSFGTTNTEAQRLVELAGAIGASDTTAQRAEATRALAVAIYESTDGLRLATDEGIALYNSLLDSASAGLELQQLDIAAGIGAGADEAARLSGNLATAAANAWAVVTARGAAAKAYSASVGGGRGPGVGGPDLDPYGFRAQLERDAATAPAVAAPSAGGGGGGASAQDDMLRAAERLYEQTRTEAEKYRAEVARLDEMLGAGAISQDVYNRALTQAEEKYGGASDAAAFFNDLNIDLKDTILDMAMGSVDALDQITEALKRAAFEALLFGSGPIANLLGLTGGLFGSSSSFLGDLFGGARAAGGPVDPSQYYLVGEKGPELFVPSARGTIVPNGPLMSGSGAAGSAASGKLEVSVSLSDGLDATIRRISGEVSVQVFESKLTAYDKTILPGRVKDISRDPRRTR